MLNKDRLQKLKDKNNIELTDEELEQIQNDKDKYIGYNEEE